MWYIFWQVFTNLQCDIFFDRRVYKLSVWCIFLMLESSWFYSVMFFEQEGLHEALVPMLQSILDSAGADNSSSLTAIITQFLKSQGKRRPISRKRQASLDLDSLKSHGKISPQTFIQGWSLVTLRKICLLWPSETVYSYKVGPLWPSETVYIYKVGLRKVSHLWPSETVYSYMVGPLWPSETTCAATRLVSCDPQKLYSYKVGLLWRSESVQLQGWSLVTLRKCTATGLVSCDPQKVYSWLPELLQQLCITVECNRHTCRPRTLCTHSLSAFSLSAHADPCWYSCRTGVGQWATGDLSLCLWCNGRFILVSLTLQL